MGIQGLIGLMDRASVAVSLSDLKGSVCVVDGNGWLHRASYGCAEQLYEGQPTNQYVSYCLRRLQSLTDAGIKPIVVFDGQRLPAKEVTHRERQSVRHNTRQKVELLLADGDVSRARMLMKQCVEVTPEMVKNLINGLRDEDIDFIVAPYEADAQMAYLVNNGFADFVVTEDSDLLVYNCRLCLFKLDVSGVGKLVDLSLLNECLGKSFDTNKFRHMAILSGCDYLSNLPGIGLQRAKKFFQMTANNDLSTALYKVPGYLNMSNKVKVTKQYVNDFIKADNTFRHQLVFCPKQKKLVPLTPYPSGVTADDIKYAGTHFDESLGKDFAFQYAIGNIDTKSLKVIDSHSFEPKADSIWSQNWFTYKNKFTTNPIVLKKSETIRVASNAYQNGKPFEDKDRPRLSHSQTLVESQSSKYFANKRIKVSESGFAVNASRLKEEYSEDNRKSISVSKSLVRDFTNTQRTTVTRSQIFSRNIFKVGNDLLQEECTQSKYFSDQNQLRSSRHPDQKSRSLSTRNTSEDIQYSFNSSGNTINESIFDNTLIDDISEISETDEEEIGATDVFTQIKTRSGESVHNSTFISASNKADIRSYFKLQ